MRKFSIGILIFLASASALASSPPRTECSGCTTLQDFGLYGAAQLWRGSGVAGPALGNDRIWVDNPTTGNTAYIDVDTPFNVISVVGFPVAIPDFTKQEVNATWIDGSASAHYILPNEIIAAQAETLETLILLGTPVNTVTEEEFEVLPLDPGLQWNAPPGGWGTIGEQNFNFDNWFFESFSVTSGSPIINITECPHFNPTISIYSCY